MVKKWLIKYRRLLIAFSIISVILAITTGIQFMVLADNLEDLKHYAETGNITKSMYKYGIFGVINLIVGFIWIVLLLILTWKLIFPDYKTMKNAFFFRELEFLLKMPTSVRKELRRK